MDDIIFDDQSGPDSMSDQLHLDRPNLDSYFTGHQSVFQQPQVQQVSVTDMSELIRQDSGKSRQDSSREVQVVKVQHPIYANEADDSPNEQMSGDEGDAEKAITYLTVKAEDYSSTGDKNLNDLVENLIKIKETLYSQRARRLAQQFCYLEREIRVYDPRFKKDMKPENRPLQSTPVVVEPEVKIVLPKSALAFVRRRFEILEQIASPQPDSLTTDDGFYTAEQQPAQLSRRMVNTLGVPGFNICKPHQRTYMKSLMLNQDSISQMKGSVAQQMLKVMLEYPEHLQEVLEETLPFCITRTETNNNNGLEKQMRKQYKKERQKVKVKLMNELLRQNQSLSEKEVFQEYKYNQADIVQLSNQVKTEPGLLTDYEQHILDEARRECQMNIDRRADLRRRLPRQTKSKGGHTWDQWTEDEVFQFEQLFGTHGKNWTKIAEELGTRTMRAVANFGRIFIKQGYVARCPKNQRTFSNQPRAKELAWKTFGDNQKWMLNRDKAQAERSERLISLIKEYGRDWETIATKLGTDYTVKNCRRRGLYVANKMRQGLIPKDELLLEKLKPMDMNTEYRKRRLEAFSKAITGNIELKECQSDDDQRPSTEQKTETETESHDSSMIELPNLVMKPRKKKVRPDRMKRSLLDGGRFIKAPRTFNEEEIKLFIKLAKEHGRDSRTVAEKMGSRTQRCVQEMYSKMVKKMHDGKVPLDQDFLTAIEMKSESNRTFRVLPWEPDEIISLIEAVKKHQRDFFKIEEALKPFSEKTGHVRTVSAIKGKTAQILSQMEIGELPKDLDYIKNITLYEIPKMSIKFGRGDRIVSEPWNQTDYQTFFNLVKLHGKDLDKIREMMSNRCSIATLRSKAKSLRTSMKDGKIPMDADLYEKLDYSETDTQYVAAIKGWSVEEHRQFVEMVKKHGRRWHLYPAVLTERNSFQVKRFAQKVKESFRRGQFLLHEEVREACTQEFIYRLLIEEIKEAPRLGLKYNKKPKPPKPPSASSLKPEKFALFDSTLQSYDQIKESEMEEEIPPETPPLSYTTPIVEPCQVDKNPSVDNPIFKIKRNRSLQANDDSSDVKDLSSSDVKEKKKFSAGDKSFLLKLISKHGADSKPDEFKQEQQLQTGNQTAEDQSLLEKIVKALEPPVAIPAAGPAQLSEIHPWRQQAVELVQLVKTFGPKWKRISETLVNRSPKVARKKANDILELMTTGRIPFDPVYKDAMANKVKKVPKDIDKNKQSSNPQDSSIWQKVAKAQLGTTTTNSAELQNAPSLKLKKETRAQNSRSTSKIASGQDRASSITENQRINPDNFRTDSEQSFFRMIEGAAATDDQYPQQDDEEEAVAEEESDEDDEIRKAIEREIQARWKTDQQPTTPSPEVNMMPSTAEIAERATQALLQQQILAPQVTNPVPQPQPQPQPQYQMPAYKQPLNYQMAAMSMQPRIASRKLLCWQPSQLPYQFKQ